MTIALRYAARSDVGLLREGNEDSAYASGRLLAVADGMGGHAHGEVASSVAIAAMASLEEAQQGGDLLNAIEAAVRDANRRLHEMVGRDPSLKGMGTTLTAMLWHGTQVALVHVGDSRAYLLRRGELYQITHDHTLVQQLVDDGRITPEEAATHPQRSILLRALDGSGEVDPDLTLREAQVGDRYLLCSDGLSGVVSAETLHATLTNIDDPEEVVRQLIDLANRGGGPDNITCVLADVVEIIDEQQAQAEASIVGAAGMARLHGSPQDGPPGRSSAVTAPQPVIADDELDEPVAEAPRSSGRRRRLWPVLVTVLGVGIVAVGGVGFFGYRWTQDQFFVGARGDEVVVFQGIKKELGPIQLFEVRKPTGRQLSQLSEADQALIRSGIPVTNVDEGMTKINALKFEQDDKGGDTPATTATTSPTPSASATKTKQR
ncbi:Stp1/IreP family PP2C-type Ser/Thr phosphatase [Nonomuraea phyllanthi]|uniref:Serine/threonine protein phosphatase PstP n=1 Tax=Nonomuraea phyllanthi TaxID=2219224 RepID=A0A5C4WRP3_9ACTN|nr:Stp1/IreP family PP2C-type Ser/Thr phosphatase [Nonomuraea phyllanthi]KAB8196292.1 Stp1/IreP family PP2C-type Ser/Thr phosphatase [Nonomuraea phyllanthi]QFY05411.1 Stp1/IreP family PP2C-type Ser/Thr phosphatase [Nonomuraea phyllanthi]